MVTLVVTVTVFTATELSEAASVFSVMVAPMPAPATPTVFPPTADQVLKAWNALNIDQAVTLEWLDFTSIPWGRVARQVEIRRPSALLGDYQFLNATVSKDFTPYLTWISPQPQQTATLVTLKNSEIRRIADLRGKIVGVIHLAYPLGGGAQQRLLESAGLLPSETNVVALGTAKEVVHHLFAGTIDAAGLPGGETEKALRQFGYPDAISEIRVIKEFKSPGNRYALFVRRDLLSPVPLFPSMLAKALSSLFEPGSITRELVNMPATGQSLPGAAQNTFHP